MSTSRTKTARTLKTEVAILDGLSVLLTEVPIGKITLSQLAKQAGLTRSTVYNQITSISHALELLAERLWVEAARIAENNANVEMKILQIIEWLSTDERIQGFRALNPEEFQRIVAELCRLENDVYASRITEMLMDWSVAADIDTATTLMRWLTSWAIEPGSARERESASELFARLLLSDVKR